MAAGGRYGVTDSMGIGLRGEVAREATTTKTTLWEVTATLDYALTDNLKTLLEVRYDHGHANVPAMSYFHSRTTGTTTRADQTLALIQMLYSF